VRQLLAAEAEGQDVDDDLSPGSPKRAHLDVDADYEEWTATAAASTENIDEVDRYLMTGATVTSEKLLEYWKAHVSLHSIIDYYYLSRFNKVNSFCYLFTEGC
jgi:hypothetical protein